MSKTTTEFLERDEEYRLHLAYKAGDRRAGDRLIKAYTPFAYRLAKESKCSVELAERQQIALIAMAKALDKFDPETGNRLNTFAKKKILWALQDANNAALCRPFTESSPLRDDIDDWHEIAAEESPEDLLGLADEWAKRSRLLNDAIDDLDDMHAELVRDVLLSDGKVAATPVLKKHGSKDTVTESLEYAMECITAVLAEKAAERGLTGTGVRKIV